MSFPLGGMQQFMRMANLFGNHQPESDMPQNLPIPDETLTAQVEDGSSTLDAFRQNVMNPPQREHMTYPKSTLNGLTKALEIAAEPSPLAKNRVWVDGQAHQKQKVFTDPATGKQHFITDVHEPSFMSQVMRAMPAAVSGATDILNQPHADALSDWDLKNKGLAAAANAESQMALAQQRRANAEAIPTKLDQGQQKIDISRLTAEERVRASQLNNLSDREKIELLQSGKVSIADINNAAALQRVQAQQAGATERVGMQQEGATERTGMQQEGANKRTGMQQTGAMERVVEGGNQARQTKQTAAPISETSAGNYPTQQRVALQAKVADVVNQHPEWEDYITFDAQGFPKIESPGWGGPTKEVFDQIYESIYGTARTGAPAPVTTTPTVTSKPVPKPVTKPVTSPKSSALPAGATETAKANAARQQKATDYLRQNGLPVTPANIAHAIKTGRVK